MDFAKCTEDGNVYPIYEFSRLPACDLARKRYLLLCTGCKEKAYYSKAASNNRVATFGARHAKGCELATQERDSIASAIGKDKNKVINTGELIVVDCNWGTSSNRANYNGEGDESTKRYAGRHVGNENRCVTQTRKCLQPLLIKLINSDVFRKSTQLIRIAGYKEMAVRDLFVSFSSISDNDINKFRGFWGRLSTVSHNNNIYRLYGERKNVFFSIDNDNVKMITEHFNVDIMTESNSIYMLYLGMIGKSKKGLYWHAIDKVEYVALYRMRQS